MTHKYGTWFYVRYVLLWTVAIIAGATVLGAIAFPIIGKLFGSSLSVMELAGNGARYIAEWTAKVWALSIAIVMAFNHAYHHRRRPTNPERGQDS